jgi:hypothetical protein
MICFFFNVGQTDCSNFVSVIKSECVNVLLNVF